MFLLTMASGDLFSYVLECFFTFCTAHVAIHIFVCMLKENSSGEYKIL